MSITDYAIQLKDDIQRKDVLEHLQGYREEYIAGIMPSVEGLREFAKTGNIDSPMYKAYAVLASRHVRSGRPIFELMLQSLEGLGEKFDFFEKLIRKDFSIIITKNALGYKEANILKYVEAIGFYIRYARRFNIRVVSEVAEKNGGLKANSTKAELNYLTRYMVAFSDLLVPMLYKTTELDKIIKDISTAIIAKDTEEIAVRSLGTTRTDPMRIGKNFYTPTDNPIFTIMRYFTEWRVSRYKEAKDELVLLELRMEELRRLSDNGETDPHTQKLITVLEADIQKLTAKIEEYEE